MAYVRFTQDDSEVYVYREDGVFLCQHLEPGSAPFRAVLVGELLKHLEQYRAAGHVVPPWVFTAIRLENAVVVGDSTLTLTDTAEEPPVADSQPASRRVADPKEGK